MQKFKYLLIPGRHQAITKFQIDNIRQLLKSKVASSSTEVIWPVTSANHSGTQRNPISGSRRLGIIEAVSSHEGIPSEVYLITNMTAKPNFAHYLIEEIRLQSNGRVDISPNNTLVICSTKEVAQQYMDLGYQIDTAEYDKTFTVKRGFRPWDVVEEIIKSGKDWRDNGVVWGELHPVCYDHFERYGLGDQIVGIFSDPLIDSEDGDITQTRDYTTYRKAFEDGAIRKVTEFADYVQPGRIMDVGCATGETLRLLTKRPGLFESDFYGVEAARPLYQICQQRKDSGDFGDSNVFFYQRNIMRSELFAHNSLNMIITMALTHEIESYLGRKELLKFIKRMYGILAPGGVYLNYDVVAPNDKDRVVYCILNEADGDNPADVNRKLSVADTPDFLHSLSTAARFRRFIIDFRASENDQINVKYETIDDQEYVVLKHHELCEFLAKKDYTDNWISEMHERFCFWEYGEWTDALQKVGFEISAGSTTKQNPWLIENRFAPAAKVFEKQGKLLVPVEQPVTNILLVAKKPI